MFKVVRLHRGLLLNHLSFGIVVMRMKMLYLARIVETIREISVLIVTDGIDGFIGFFASLFRFVYPLVLLLQYLFVMMYLLII